jgi:hypothetical protein
MILNIHKNIAQNVFEILTFFLQDGIKTQMITDTDWGNPKNLEKNYSSNLNCI